MTAPTEQLATMVREIVEDRVGTSLDTLRALRDAADELDDDAELGRRSASHCRGARPAAEWR